MATDWHFLEMYCKTCTYLVLTEHLKLGLNDPNGLAHSVIRRTIYRFGRQLDSLLVDWAICSGGQRLVVGAAAVRSEGLLAKGAIFPVNERKRE